MCRTRRAGHGAGGCTARATTYAQGLAVHNNGDARLIADARACLYHIAFRWEAVKRTFVGPDDEEVQLILPQGLVKTIGHKKLKVERGCTPSRVRIQ